MGKQGRRLPGKYFLLFIHGLEQVGELAERFRRTEKQESFGFQRIVKGRQRPLLQSGLQVDQQVAATDQIHFRKRRITDQILARENHRLAKRLGDSVAALLLDEKPSQSLRRNVGCERLGVKTGARLVEQRVVQVGREDLHFRRVGNALG